MRRYSDAMAEGYSWNYVKSDRGNRLPGPEHLGWWAVVAMVVSIVLHILVFLALNRMEIALSFHQAEELRTAAVNVSQVEVRPSEEPPRLNPEDDVKPPEQTASLMEEIDLLAALPENQEIEMRPDLKEPEFALKMSRPSPSGEIQSVVDIEMPQQVNLNADMPEIGQEPVQLKPAEIGQVTVDPGARLDDLDSGRFTEDLLKQGARGKVDKGVLDGLATLDALLELPPNILLSKKTMLPSDLLFEFNRAELRESAKVGLMKLALLMDRNPNLYCWIEGHTDLIGGDEFNKKLSIRRAEAVKEYLVKSLRMDGERIVTRGFGREQPLIREGDAEDQAPNRRVEIRMRKTLPPADTSVEREAEAPPVAEPVLIKPKRALPVAPPAVPADPPPRAQTVVPVAPVVEEVPRAQAVEPPGEPAEAPRAQTVIPGEVPRANVIDD